MTQKSGAFNKLNPEAILFILIALIYFVTGAVTVTGEDSGSFHLALTSPGINHPPGYPLYTVLGFVFVKIFSFLTSETHLVNLFSAVWTLLALYVFRLILVKKSFSMWTRVFATGACAFSAGLWSQTAVAEVYSLNVFLSILAIYLFMFFSEKLEAAQGSSLGTSLFRSAYAFSFVCGLGVAHHYPLFLLTLTPFVLHLWFSTSNEKLKIFFTDKRFLVCLGAFSLGLTPYLYLLLPIFNEFDYVFGNLHSLKDVWNHIMRKSYSVVDFQQTTLSDKLAYQVNMLELVWVNLRAFSVFAVLGIISAIKSDWKKNLVFLVSALGTTFILAGILSFPADSLYTAVFRVYPLPGLMIFTFFAAYGLDSLFKNQPKTKLASIIVCFLILAHQGYSNYFLSNRSDFNANLNGATAYLESLPKDSILLVSGDEGISIYFAHKLLGIRPDVLVVAYENSYTKEKILSYEEYKVAKKDPALANKLRAKKIVDWAMGSRPLVSMVNIAFESTGIPSRSLVYGFAANRKGFNFSPPEEFFRRFINMDYIKTLIPTTPRPDHWSDGNTLNYAPTLVALMAIKGENVYELLKKIKSSDLGQTRKDLFSLRTFEFEKRVAVKLMELEKFDQVVLILKDIKSKVPYEKMAFPVKTLYCTSLAKIGKIELEREFCQKVLLERQYIEKMQNNSQQK